MGWSVEQAQAWWGRAQGLGGRPAEALEQTVARTGWLRALGGVGAYLALAARAREVTVQAVDRAVADRRLQVLPAARGCMYLVPRQDAALALRLADLLSRRRMARDLEKAGVPPDELRAVGEAVCEALRQGPLDTRALARALPEGTVRSLGAAGKKVGLSTPLPPALRRLELDGQVVRQPVDHRLDHERYLWALPPTDPLAGAPETEAEVHAAVTRRFLRWAGPATRKELAAWTGLGQRDAKAALAAAGARAVEVEGLGEAWIDPELDEPAPRDPAADRYLPTHDNLFALGLRAAAVVDPAGHHIEVDGFGRGKPRPLAEVPAPMVRTVARSGRVVGLWEPEGDRIRTRGFGAELADPAEVPEVAAILTTLGHARTFGLDSPARQAARLERVRAR